MSAADARAAAGATSVSFRERRGEGEGMALVVARHAACPLGVACGGVGRARGAHPAMSDRQVATASAEVLARLEAMIVEALADDTLELEARIGRVSGTAFAPGVTRQHMDAIVRGLDLLCEQRPDRMCAADVGQWREHEDYHFAADGRRMRTRVTYDGDAVRICADTVEKVTLRQVVLKTHVLDVRIALSRETRVERPPAVVRTSHVRIKQRRTFQAVGAPFVFDCSMVWSGETHARAERKQSEEEPTFEIECELVGKGAAAQAWRARHGARAHRMAQSLLYKVADMMMATGLEFV